VDDVGGSLSTTLLSPCATVAARGFHSVNGASDSQLDFAAPGRGSWPVLGSRGPVDTRSADPTAAFAAGPSPEIGAKPIPDSRDPSLDC
jgi:hypothetical protein